MSAFFFLYSLYLTPMSVYKVLSVHLYWNVFCILILNITHHCKIPKWNIRSWRNKTFCELLPKRKHHRIAISAMSFTVHHRHICPVSVYFLPALIITLVNSKLFSMSVLWAVRAISVFVLYIYPICFTLHRRHTSIFRFWAFFCACPIVSLCVP